MTLNINTRVQLNNGVEMPVLGLGVFKLRNGKEVERVVTNALIHGYRSIDTAQAYHNEKGVGNAIKASGVPRKDIFITTKVKNDMQGYKKTIKSFYQSLKDLQTDYVDLFLIHWPKEKVTLNTWKAMEMLYQKGLVRAIGVSNFQIHHLKYLLDNCTIPPAVNQVEFNPEHSQPKLLTYCNDNNIRLEAWGPLMEGRVNAIPEIKLIAEKYNKTPVQVVLRWDLQKGVITIPKSSKLNRIRDNANIFDFELSNEDIQMIDSLNINNPRIKHYDKYLFLTEMLLKQRTRSLLKTFMGATVYKTKQKIKHLSLGSLFVLTQELYYAFDEVGLMLCCPFR